MPHEPPAPPAPRIRLAVPGDAPAVVAIVNGAYRGDPTGQGWTTEAHLVEGPRITEAGFHALLARPRSAVLVAEVRGTPAGCVHLQARDEVCTLGMLAVRVAGQGSGLGKALVAAGEEHARRAMGARRMVMQVLSVRPELLAWYERRGYQRTGRRVPFEAPPDQRFLRGPLEFEVLEKILA